MERRSVKEASVEGVQRRMQPKKHFVFCIKVTWSDGTVNLVYRRYRRFLHVQTVLLQAFPVLGGQGSKRRQFVPLPDSVTARMNIGDSIFRRMEQVNYFLKEILELDSKVSQSIHVLTFLTPTPEDLEPQHRTPVKGKRKQRNGRNISGKMKGRLQKFGKTVKPWGNKISSPIVLEHFIVMEDYKKQAKSDINLKKGRAVDVIEKRECGWWLVDADGEVGWAPALYLEPADDMADCSNAMTFPIGRGEVYATTKRYVAGEEDELTFEIGVNLQILEKNYDGWWKAQYLGKEGWVPAMYLRKLGNDKRKTGRRKSRMFSTTQLREVDDIVEEETILEETEAEIAAEEPEKKNEDKKKSLPRKISDHILFRGEHRSKENSVQPPLETVPEEDNDNANNTLKRSPKEEKKTITSMIAMSSPLMQLNEDKKTQEPRPQPSPRLQFKRRAISSLASASPILSLTLDSEGTRDDMSLKEKSQTLSALGSNHNSVSVSSWTPEVINKFSPGLDRVRKISAPAHIEMENQKRTELDFSPIVNDISPSKENVAKEDQKVFEGLEKVQESDDDDDDEDSTELMQYSTSSTEIEECSTGYNGVHADSALFLKSNSLGRDSPKFAPPRRNPPEPLKTVTWPRNVMGPLEYSESAQEKVYAESEEDTSSDEGSPDEEREFSRAMEAENLDFVQQENHSTTNSLRSDRSIIRQERFEKETSEELNQEINYWSSSDDSEPELAQMLLSKVAVQHETSHSPAMENNHIEEGNDHSLHSSVSSNESLGLQYIERIKSRKDDSSDDVYCTLEQCEVDGEMTLSKGDCVRVLEKAATGWWLVQNDEGLKGWAPSNFLYPTLEVEDGAGSRLPDSEETSRKQSNLQRSFYAIEEYRGDPDNKEVCLRKGEIAHVVHKSESGWWCVRNENGEVGWAPSTYLEELTNNNDTVFLN